MVKSSFTQGLKQNGKSKNTMLTTREVARIFNVHPATIRRWCSQDKIKSHRTHTGGKLLFKREDVAVAYLEKSIRGYLKVLSSRS